MPGGTIALNAYSLNVCTVVRTVWICAPWRLAHAAPPGVNVNLVSANRTDRAAPQRTPARPTPQRRRHPGGCDAVALIYLLREPLRVSLDKLTIRLPNAQRHLPAAGLRILHLTDTHFRGLDWREKAKIDAVRRACAGLDYDLLVHTGDFLHDDGGLGNVLDLLDALPAPRLGAFAVFGNHDYTTYSANQLLNRSWTAFAPENGNRPRQSNPGRSRPPCTLRPLPGKRAVRPQTNRPQRRLRLQDELVAQLPDSATAPC